MRREHPDPDDLHDPPGRRHPGPAARPQRSADRLLRSAENRDRVVDSLVDQVVDQGWVGVNVDLEALRVRDAVEWTATLPGGDVVWWSDSASYDRRRALATELGLHGLALWRLGSADRLVG